jgi:pantetheine-phosphate adenylyltransferase
VTIGVYAGSFDPLHLGHLSLIEIAAGWCETLYVVAAGNPSKRGGLFDLDERRALLEASTRHLDNVIALRHAGLVAPLAVELGADVLIRGMGKEGYLEIEMAVANERTAGVPTVFLPPAIETQWIASRTVRAELEDGGLEQVRAMVPPPVADALATKLARTAVSQT